MSNAEDDELDINRGILNVLDQVSKIYLKGFITFGSELDLDLPLFVI